MTVAFSSRGASGVGMCMGHVTIGNDDCRCFVEKGQRGCSREKKSEQGNSKSQASVSTFIFKAEKAKRLKGRKGTQLPTYLLRSD